MHSSGHQRIAITGEGIVSAIGLNKEQTLEALIDERSGIGPIRHLRSRHSDLPVGEVDMSTDELRAHLGANDDTPRTSLLGIMAVKEALDDAGLSGERSAETTILISGTTVGGMDVTETRFAHILATRQWDHCLSTHDCGTSTRLIAEHFGIFDDICTISTACSSAANALILGAKLLMTGKADIVVAGGSESLSCFHLNGFNSLMILDHERCRPFDRDRRGLNLGEGAAFVVMETEEHARKRGAAIHGYLAGFGNACDAFHQTATSEQGIGAQLAMREALATAGLSPEDIDYINAHGTGTPDNDIAESRAIISVFGEDSLPPVSSTKSYTGHTTSASGSIEGVICLLAMRHGFIPANLGWANQIDGGVRPTMGVKDTHPRRVMCNSFGFGGNDSSLIFSLDAPDKINFRHDAGVAIKRLSEVSIESDEELAEVKRFVKPMELRRMGKLMRASLLAAMKALEEAGVTCPDAIITGTAYGCLENSQIFLTQIIEREEGLLQPTHFMQSTHNTLGGQIAIRLGCHGYNVTYTQCDRSLDCAIADAELLLRSGAAKTVLVGYYDEITELFNELNPNTDRSGHTFTAKAMVLSCGA